MRSPFLPGLFLSLCIVSAVRAADERVATLIFAGDVMLDEIPGERIAQGKDPFAGVETVLKTADVTIANLECVVATTGAPVKDKPYTFRAHPRVLPVLARHFGIVSLANNHTVDFGHEAFLEQLDLLKQHRIAWFGGGRDNQEARRPHIIEVKGIRIALLGYNDFHPRDFEAGPEWPGTAWAVKAQMEADVAFARTKHRADVVIPFMHWGEEYVPENERQRKLAQSLIKAGASMVVGGHPHVTQGVEFYSDRLIVYSLGNFVFNGFPEGERRRGWLLRVRVNKQGLASWDTIAYHLDEDGLPQLTPDVKSPSGDAHAVRK